MSKSKIILKNFDKLKTKTVAIVGVGGTGNAVAQLLARTGIKLILIDRDIVEKSNLERQTLYDIKDVGKPKVQAAKEKLKQFSEIDARFDDLNNKNIYMIKSDLVIDCSDNIETRLLINDYCKKNKINWIYSGGISKIGAIYFNRINGPCFQCFNGTRYGETCSQVGVLSSTVAIVGALTASIAINFLSEGKMENDMIRINLETDSLDKIKVNKNDKCECCNGNYKYLNGESTKKIIRCCSSETYQINTDINFDEVKKRLKIKSNDSFIKYKDAFITKDRVLVKASTEKDAKKKYDEIVGM